EMRSAWPLHRRRAQESAMPRMQLTDPWVPSTPLAARLLALGIATPLDLNRGDARLIRERLGVVTMRLALELRGVRSRERTRSSLEMQNARRNGSERARCYAFLETLRHNGISRGYCTVFFAG